MARRKREEPDVLDSNVLLLNVALNELRKTLHQVVSGPGDNEDVQAKMDHIEKLIRQILQNHSAQVRSLQEEIQLALMGHRPKRIK